MKVEGSASPPEAVPHPAPPLRVAAGDDGESPPTGGYSVYILWSQSLGKRFPGCSIVTVRFIQLLTDLSIIISSILRIVFILHPILGIILDVFPEPV